MNPYTGEIKLFEKEVPQGWKEVDPSRLAPLKRQQLALTGSTKIGRNDPCPCGSGSKFKKCCLASE